MVGKEESRIALIAAVSHLPVETIADAEVSLILLDPRWSASHSGDLQSCRILHVPLKSVEMSMDMSRGLWTAWHTEQHTYQGMSALICLGCQPAGCCNMGHGVDAYVSRSEPLGLDSKARLIGSQ